MKGRKHLLWRVFGRKIDTMGLNMETHSSVCIEKQGKRVLYLCFHV